MQINILILTKKKVMIKLKLFEVLKCDSNRLNEIQELSL